MTPGARIQAAIELITEIGQGRAAADDVVGGYFRRHRFAGSKDRAAISEHIYAVLRRRAAIDWYIERVAPGQDPRALGDLPVASPVLAAGHGFGLTFAISRGPAQTGMLPPAGQYRWGGAAGTAFWIDTVVTG